MPNWWESAKNIAKNAYCEVAEFGEWYAGGVATLLDETRLDELAEFQLEYAQWANRKFCGKSPSTSTPEYLQPPFTGGQCVGIFYNVVAAVDEMTSAGVFVRTITNTVGAIGKIRGAKITTTQKGAFVEFGNAPPYSQSTIAVLGSTSNVLANARIVSLSRGDGLADTCGNPPIPAIPPSDDPLVVVRDVDYDDENGSPQTDEDVTFTFDTPIKEPDGTISVPYTICKDGFCVKGKVNLGDELIALDDSPSEEYLAPMVELDDPVGEGTITPESELDGEPLSEADKAKKPILGVFVKAQKDGLKSKATEVFLDDDAPAILVPNIGYVRFRILHGDESGWLADIPIKSVNTYVPVPDNKEAVSCEVAFQVGWKGKYIVHRGTACCKECEESSN